MGTNYQGWENFLMIALISIKKLGGYKIMRNTVHAGKVNLETIMDICLIFMKSKHHTVTNSVFTTNSGTK